jgi:hypothetical protein
MAWDNMRHITTMHDEAWHGMEKDNMTHITTMHDGLTQHDRLADRNDEEGRIDWSVMSEKVVIDPTLLCCSSSKMATKLAGRSPILIKESSTNA